MSNNSAEANRAYQANAVAKKKLKHGKPPNALPAIPSVPQPNIPEWWKLVLARIQATDSKAQAAVMQMNVLIETVKKLCTHIDHLEQHIAEQHRLLDAAIEDRLARLHSDNATLSAQTLRSHQFILRLLDDPEALHHAEAIVRDFNIQKYTTP